MTDPRSERLIERLASDLQPVEPIPPLPRRLIGVLAVAVVVAAGAFALYGAIPDLWQHIASDVTYTTVLLGLAAGVAGACTAALASVVPGRETLVRVGAGAAALGLLAAVGVAAWSTPWSTAALDDPLRQLSCVARGTVLAALPAAAVLLLAARGWSGRPELTVALGLLGTGALGALLVHLTCPAVAPLHALCTHASTPLLVALLLTAVLTPVMRRWAR